MPKGIYKHHSHQGFQKGQHPSPKTEFKKGQNAGKNNINWQGRRKSKGWIYLLRPNHPFAIRSGYILRSRLIMEKKIGRYLKPVEVIHHINGNRSDDRIENLMLFPNQGEHLKFHHIHRLSKRTRQ